MLIFLSGACDRVTSRTMDLRAEIARLRHDNAEQRAETAALRIMLIGLLQGLKQAGPPGEALLEETFRYAEFISEIAAIPLGSERPSRNAFHIAEVIEQLRAAVTVGNGQPKGGI